MRRFKRYVWVLVLAAVAVGGYFFLRSRKARSEEPTYQTATVERRDIVVAVAAVGEMDPLTTVDVKANVAGEVVELAVDRGDLVMAGDLIASIDPTETQSAYDQARADVTSATARVRETETELRRQRKLAPANVSAAGTGVESAVARVRQAESALSLQIKETEASIRKSEEAVKSAEARLRQAQSRERAQPDITEASIRKARGELRASKEALKRLAEATHPAEKAATKAQLGSARVSLDNDRKKLERLRRLQARGAVSQQEYEDGEKAFASSQNTYESAKATAETLGRKQSSELREAEARVEQAQAGLDTARANSIDVRIARQEREAVEATVREAEAALAAAVAGRARDMVKLQELRAANAQTKEARAQVRVAEANALTAVGSAHQVSQAKAGRQRSDAELAKTLKNLAYTTITAPRDGVVIDKYVEQGTVISSGRSNVSDGSNIVTIADISRMFVLAEVDEADIGRVKVGQPAEIEIETFADEKFRGKVIQVYPRGEEIENVVVFKVRIEVANPQAKLRPGMTAEVSIISARKTNVLAVPTEAVFQQEGKSFAEVIKEGQPKTVPVGTGLSDFEWIEITKGLQEGDEVVLESGAGPGGGGPGGSRDMRRMMRMGGGSRR